MVKRLFVARQKDVTVDKNKLTKCNILCLHCRLSSLQELILTENLLEVCYFISDRY